MTALKKILLGLMLFGAVTFFGGGGTFASFSAETANNGSTVASGTLTMTDKVDTNIACLSANGSAQNNVNPACDKVFQLTNVAPGVFGGTAKIAIQNTGSLDASKLSFWASSVNATVSAAGIANPATITSIPITALEGNIAGDDTIRVSYGTHFQDFSANGATAGGATAIAVSSQASNFAYPLGATVVDTSSNTTASNQDCFDTKTTAGNALNFNAPAGNPLCGALQISVQEQTGGFNYCWLGKGSGASPQASGGACVAPIGVTLTTALTTGGLGPTTLAVTTLNGNVAAGDHIVVSSGSNKQTFIASASAFIGATSISITQTPALNVYPIGASVTDSDATGALNSGTGTTTLTAFDTTYSTAGKVFLAPLTTNGNSDGAAPVQLGHAGAADTRTFYVSVYLPAPPGTTQNQLQGLSSTFGITWHIDQ